MRLSQVAVLVAVLWCTSGALKLRSSDIPSESILDDITYCAFKWLDQLPPVLKEQNNDVLDQLGGSVPENLKFLPLLEPYLTYMAGMSDSEDDGFIDVFTNYCNYRHGVMSFMACTQTRPSMGSLQMTSLEVGDLAMQLYTRYCDSGKVKKSAMLSLLRGKESKAIGQLSRDVMQSLRLGTKMVCSEVVDSFFQTIMMLLGSNDSKEVLDAITSGAEDFSKCILSAYSEDHSLKLLTEHADMVLLHIVGLNMAAITKSEVKSGRVSVAMVGYANIIKGDNQAVTCATTGTHVLLENEKIAVTGTMLYDRSQGSLIPYLAAVYVKVTLYSEGDWNPVGQVTYSTGSGSGPLKDLLTSFWWKDEMEGRSTNRDHGVSIQSVGGTRDILDMNSQINVVISKESNKMSVVVRMDNSALFQSRGLLVEDCPYNRHATHFGVVQATSECQDGCQWVAAQVANTVCKKDCGMKNTEHEQVIGMYLSYEEMLVIAATKDDLFESEEDTSTTEPPEEIHLDFIRSSRHTTPLYLNTGPSKFKTYAMRNRPLTTESYAREIIAVNPTTQHFKTPKAKVVKISNSRAIPFSVPKPNRGELVTSSITCVSVLVLASLLL